MTVSLTPSARLVALVGLLCACALGSGALLLARRHATTAPTATPPVAHPRSRAVTPSRHAVTSTRHHHSMSAAKPAASVAPKPKAPAVVVDSKIPTAVAAALQNHSVVVTALYAPGAETDPTAVAEAQAGAQLAGAGFVKLNVLDEAVAKQLARVADQLSDPAVLLFRKTGVVIRIDGFADRDLVAQAAQNAESQSAASR
jgi:hypothetical protein